MRLGGGRVGERRDRAFVPPFELGLSVRTVTCLRICWQLKFCKSFINKYLYEHNFKIIDK